MKKSVISVMLALFIAVLSSLAGCGGGGGGDDAAPANTVSGIVSAGAVLSGTVYLTDSSSQPKSLFTAIAADGSYSFDVTGMTKPYLLKAFGTASGQYYTLYALAADKGTTNINQSTRINDGNTPP
jgi:hypothetical protein